jgi:hypothetical protein
MNTTLTAASIITSCVIVGILLGQLIIQITLSSL